MKEAKKIEIANLPGYSELIRDWIEASEQIRTGFRSRMDYLQWLMRCQGVSLGLIPEEDLRLLTSNDFFEACRNQLLREENRKFREDLFKAIMGISYSEALRMYSMRAQEIQKNEHMYEREEQP